MEKDVFEQYRSLKVLILEDIPEDAELMIKALEAFGFLVESMIVDDERGFNDGLDNFLPELILADYALPTITGLEALAITIHKQAKIPFVFVTGTVGEEIAAETILNGASGLVLKSNISRLPEVINDVFRKEGRWFSKRLKIASERVKNRIDKNLKALERVEKFLGTYSTPPEISNDINKSIEDLKRLNHQLYDEELET